MLVSQQSHSTCPPTSHAADLESWYSDSVPDTEQYFVCSEMESRSASHATSQTTDVTSRADSAAPSPPQEQRWSNVKTRRASIFRFGNGGKASPAPKPPGLKKKGTFADLRQTIADAELPKRLKQLAGIKRSRKEGDDTEQQPMSKAARTGTN